MQLSLYGTGCWCNLCKAEYKILCSAELYPVIVPQEWLRSILNNFVYMLLGYAAVLKVPHAPNFHEVLQ
jgi:hypothetical protein